ncbi:hypothetical protein Mnod_2544 [Methylobacterium nodulans ORS 2060]|uniref:Uncharacterized protein n=1 Tax=Methylobacterium nodulans (strain LMG 21967 / CNCM I-2342 / ORS 2060) TaxID=460265 RepID=B8ICU9_METNO|nr:hypothetical protein Mnod_2544 [Methylobacterium nodulans ORS 2060]
MLFAALMRCKLALMGVSVMSGLVNLLCLSGSFYLLEVYDRFGPQTVACRRCSDSRLAPARYTR